MIVNTLGSNETPRMPRSDDGQRAPRDRGDNTRRAPDGPPTEFYPTDTPRDPRGSRGQVPGRSPGWGAGCTQVVTPMKNPTTGETTLASDSCERRRLKQRGWVPTTEVGDDFPTMPAPEDGGSGGGQNGDQSGGNSTAQTAGMTTTLLVAGAGTFLLTQYLSGS